MNMLAWNFTSRSKLNSIETAVIEAVAAALPNDAAALLRTQVSLVNKVQRIDRDREVDFYHMEKGKPAFPDTALFPNRTEEFILAKVHLTNDSTGHQSNATITLVKGRLFCIEFSHTPRDLCEVDELSIEIEQLDNPMNT